MLKSTLIISLALLTTACTLHPETEKSALNIQAERQAVYDNTHTIHVEPTKTTL